ncbi:polymorphic toxin-type HINT domain-containing protein [Nonomuraea jabiensis]|uniref:polymorphic toxin-type HINT domain-containing protein n=1 Tax=Nonomuraea jabiensis TaxID=882448 RepID=UPI0036B8268E
MLAGGATKPIEDIKVGDRIIATDPATGLSEAQPVTAVITGSGVKNLVRITDGTDGTTGASTGVLVATDEHSFWVVDRQAWTAATRLEPGMWLRTSTGTPTKQRTAVR